MDRETSLGGKGEREGETQGEWQDRKAYREGGYSESLTRHSTEFLFI